MTMRLLERDSRQAMKRGSACFTQPAGRSERPICGVGSVAPPCDLQPRTSSEGVNESTPRVTGGGCRGERRSLPPTLTQSSLRRRLASGPFSSALGEVLVGEEGDGGHGAPEPLDRVLRREDPHLANGLGPDAEGFVKHPPDRALGGPPVCDVVVLHDDPRLGGVIRQGLADRGCYY